MGTPVLIVVDDPEDLTLRFEGVEVVTARDYLTSPEYGSMKGARVFNLCRSFRYQSVGYYVSLLAAARGQKPIPSITTIQDLKTRTMALVAADELDELIQKGLAPIQSREFTLSIYFGKNLAKRHGRLSARLFGLFQAPFLRAVFVRRGHDGRWHLKSISPMAAGDIPEEHREFAEEAAQEFFKKKRTSRRRKVAPRYDLAILHDPDEEEPPSDERALKRFASAAESLGLAAELVTKDDFGRLAEFDALFIRETTGVTHHTYRFARRAAAEGLVVVDDPESILKCSNKVFLAELLGRHRIATPKTMIVSRENARSVAGAIGLPCVLKRPDSSFSLGVMKVDEPDRLGPNISRMLERSDLIIAQEFIPTSFDWRVGVFDRHPLFVCRYHMPPKHWQIVKRAAGRPEYGKVDTMAVEHAPAGVVRTALKAANLIGDGLYGVDIKERGKTFYVIEVNDNPNIDSGMEDAVLGGELYERIMGVLLRRVELRKERGRHT